MNIIPYTRKAQFYETDQMGIIHHSNYIRWFEEARVDFMDQTGFGYKRASSTGIDFAVLSVTCDYISMVRFGNIVKIHMTISALTASKLTIKYKVIDAEDGQIRATGESRHCCYHNRRQRPVSLKKELPELYGLFAALCEDEDKVRE